MEQSKINSLLQEKIGNLILFFSNGEKTSLIKILKLLYIADETAIKKYGAPISWLEYKAWMRGPVASDLFDEAERITEKRSEVSGGLDMSEYMDVILDNEIRDQKHTMSISPLKEFDDSEFSDAEIKILDQVKKDFGSLSVTKLVHITHAEDSLWDQTVKANDLKKAFKISARTDYPISIFKLLKGKKIEAYKHALDILEHEMTF
ncbi:Panacea domain-containing protein [Fluviicola sp.]|jgi:uncharacterized phage-associated protein|uniref:Panacea domain-containing protein n=1 Tax=Fluviicola sp. TaxID=1917219 RepID=UPI0028332BB3|nr:Panacea domain-containing protein [Fluviicola sp.]MDR0801926.1 SocA family protein [Fluviicola sp.]